MAKLKITRGGSRSGKTLPVETKPVEVVDDDLTVLSKFMETPIGGHLPNLRFSPLVEVRPWTVFTTPGIQLCAASLKVLVVEMRRLLKT